MRKYLGDGIGWVEFPDPSAPASPPDPMAEFREEFSAEIRELRSALTAPRTRRVERDDDGNIARIIEETN